MKTNEETSTMNPKVDFYFDKATAWQEEIVKMREIVLSCGLTEDLKWGVPCYTWEGRNIVIIHTFKEYCAFLFFKGSLMADPAKIMIQQSQQVQAARQVRFTKVSEITKLKTTLKAYIYEAIEVEKAGLKVPMKKTSDYAVAEEFQAQLNKSATLKKAFEALTPGRQRSWLLHFSSAKQSKTRVARIEKAIPLIRAGKGFNE